MELIITLIIVFILFPLLLLFLFGFLPIKLRSYRLNKIAHEFGLMFESNYKNTFTVGATESYKRNIMKGNIKNHAIEAFDMYEFHRGLLLRGSTGYYVRFSAVVIDGQQSKLYGIVGLPSVRKIKNTLLSI